MFHRIEQNAATTRRERKDISEDWKIASKKWAEVQRQRDISKVKEETLQLDPSPIQSVEWGIGINKR